MSQYCSIFDEVTLKVVARSTKISFHFVLYLPCWIEDMISQSQGSPCMESGRMAITCVIWIHNGARCSCTGVVDKKRTDDWLGTWFLSVPTLSTAHLQLYICLSVLQQCLWSQTFLSYNGSRKRGCLLTNSWSSGGGKKGLVNLHGPGQPTWAYLFLTPQDNWGCWLLSFNHDTINCIQLWKQLWAPVKQNLAVRDEVRSLHADCLFRHKRKLQSFTVLWAS